LDRLKTQARAWAGPLSAAVYLAPGDSEAVGAATRQVRIRVTRR
jgi:hypothetical protein